MSIIEFPVVGWEKCYSIFSDGTIYSKRYCKNLKLYYTKRGKYHCHFYNNGQVHIVRVNKIIDDLLALPTGNNAQEFQHLEILKKFYQCV